MKLAKAEKFLLKYYVVYIVVMIPIGVIDYYITQLGVPASLSLEYLIAAVIFGIIGIIIYLVLKLKLKNQKNS